jgi:hypothetical protein
MRRLIKGAVANTAPAPPCTKIEHEKATASAAASGQPPSIRDIAT